MELKHREQPMVEDVMFESVAKQVVEEYRGMAGGMAEPEHLPVDTMEGLMVDKKIPEGFYGKPYVAPETPVTPEVTEENLWRGGSVTLSNDITAETTIQVENGIKTEVNLNGKKILGGLFTESNGTTSEGNTDSYAFWVKKGGELVIDGEGEVESQEASYSMAVWADGGKVTINNGTFVNHGDGCDLIYASNGATVEIYGGEFKATENTKTVPATKNRFSALNIKDKDRKTTKILVYGGKFYGFDPSNNVSEGEGTNFVAEGYKSVETSEGIWEVMQA